MLLKHRISFVLKFNLDILPDDKNTILILAGDCFNGNRINYTWFEVISNQFYKIIYIFNNI